MAKTFNALPAGEGLIAKSLTVVISIGMAFSNSAGGTDLFLPRAQKEV